MSAVPPESVLLLSCGGYRSGSTYCYNLLGDYAERSNLGRRIGYLEPDQIPELARLWSVVDALGVAVGKSHNAPGTAQGAQAWWRLLDRVAPVCTVRDWRDVLHSFSRKYGESPETVLDSRRWHINLISVRWWLSVDALLLRYEDLVGHPQKVVSEVAAWCGLPVVAGLAAEAAAAASFTEAAVVAAGLGPHDIDARTLLHDDHLAAPEGGAWRQWGPDRLRLLRPRLEPLLEEFGYVW